MRTAAAWRWSRSVVLRGAMGGLIALSASVAAAADPASATRPTRARKGLLVLYDFANGRGAVIRDRAGAGSPLDLRIRDSQSVVRKRGSLEVRSNTLIRSSQPPERLIAAIRRSNALTLEAWIRPANLRQKGPARILTLSRDARERNFTFGQEGDRFQIRVRTSATSVNGIPALTSPARSVTTRTMHVVYTRNRRGQTHLFVNGKPTAQGRVAGGTRVWKGNYQLALGNELSRDRPWLGTYYLVAIYGRDLTAAEIARNYAAGADGKSAPQLAQRPGAELFETKIAPLLANHCLECHDAPSKKGGLDLSHRLAALKGGEQGAAIVAGKSAQSLLWQRIQKNEMPPERAPLSAAQKKLIQRWIDGGAAWTLATIDPAIYRHQGRSADTWVQRLTRDEYVETVRSTVGVDIAADARQLFPADLRADGFSNTAYNLNVDLKHVEAYAQLAERIVQRMDVVKFAARFSRRRRLTDDDMRDLIAKMGKWVLRGPLEEHEVDAYRGVSTTVASAGGGFKEAVRYILEAMLQSPRFVYRVENQRGDGGPWPVSEFELASRLSYIIWGGPPDAELYRAADQGVLSDAQQLKKQAQRMLKDPRAIKRSRQFVHDWLDLGRLRNLRPDPKRFPQWNRQLADDLREETLAFFEEIVWKQQRPLRDLLNAQLTFATPRLAKHYGLTPGRDGRTRYDLTKVNGRGGLLTHGSVLTVGGDEASMVSRGLFVLQELLRGVVKDPPPCVDTTPVPTKAGLTQRSIALARIGNPACGGCHSRFEPLAFGLEKFDGIGGYHERDEHGNRLRDDGQILFPGSAKAVAYKSSKQLMDLLAQSDRVQLSLTWKLAQFSLGRPLTAGDAAILNRIHKQAKRDGGTYTSRILALVTSDLVLTTRTEKTQ